MHTGLQTVATLDHGQGNPRNSEGSFMTLQDGRILFAYSRFEGDSGMDEGRAVIACLISADNGLTWTAQPRPIISCEGELNVMSVSLLRLQSGRIALFYIRKDHVDCHLMIRTSGDEGATWTDPVLCTRACGYHVVNNDRVIQLSDGALIVPATLHRTYANAEGKPLDVSVEHKIQSLDLQGANTFFRSDDEGATWRSAGAWWTTPTGMAQEAGIIELREGSLYSWCRTDLGCQWCASSIDGGATWSVPEATPFRSPISPMSMKRLSHSGDLVAIWNDHDPRWNFPTQTNPWTGRTPLAIALSHDDGKTWDASRLLETDPEHGYCYIAIHEIKDALLLAYCCGKTGAEQLSDLKILRVPFAWLYGE